MTRHNLIRAVSWGRVPPRKANKKEYSVGGYKPNREDIKKTLRGRPLEDPLLERKKRFDKVRPFAENIRRRLREARVGLNQDTVSAIKLGEYWAKQVVKTKKKVGGSTLGNFINDAEKGNLLERLMGMGKKYCGGSPTRPLLEVYEERFADYAAILGRKGLSYRSLMQGISKIQPRFRFKKSNLKPYKG